jgi:hypothetical protein
VSSDPASPSTAHQREAAVELLIAGRSGPTFVLDPAIDNVLGRAAEALVVLPDRLASRVHAVLRFDPAANEWTLRDLGSRNGTWLGGTRVTNATLTDGAVLRVGTSELVFHLATPTDTPPDAPEGMRLVRCGPVGRFEGMALKRSASSADGVRWQLLLYQAGIRLLASRTIRDVIGTSLELAAEHCGGASFGWFRAGADRLDPVCVVPPGCDLMELVTVDPVRRVIDEGQAAWIHVEPRDGQRAVAHELVCIPVTERRRGDAVLAAAAPGGSFRDADFDFLVALASLASAACAGRAEDVGGGGDFDDDPASLHTVPLDPLQEVPEGTLTLSAEAAEALVREPRPGATDQRVGACVTGASTLRLDEWQRVLVIEALRRAGGSVPNAANELGISRATLYRKLEAFGLTRAAE